MGNDCRDCEYLETKEIPDKKINYGYCKKTKLVLLCLQNNCESHKESEETDG